MWKNNYSRREFKKSSQAYRTFARLIIMEKTSFQFALILFFLHPGSFAQEPVSYDESKVPSYVLPELLVTKDGREIKTAREWTETRRPEVMALFEEYIYGKIPGELDISSYRVLEQDDNALGGRAVRKQVVLEFRKSGRELEVHLLLYLPKGLGKVPVFVGYNFNGNHTVSDDPEVFVTQSWVRNSPNVGIENHRSNEKARGMLKNRWDIDMIINSGYGLVTLYYGDVHPDKNDFTEGVHPMLYKEGQDRPLPDEWGSISAWAWGLSRVMDYFEGNDDIDHDRVIVMGHSRLGKTALWTGALDQRFAIVISNNSGCGGAALSRRRFGERLGHMNRAFPHWLCDNAGKFDWDEDTLPVDQHMLIALMAPRPVYIASAEKDRWADPEGEYLSGYHATPVYELFGRKGFKTPEMPEVNSPVMNTIGYHIRSGGHNVTSYDWEQFIRFANLHMKP